MMKNELEKQLSSLNPGKDSKGLLKEYYRNKNKRMIVFSIVIMTFIFLAIQFEMKQTPIVDDYYLTRNHYGKGSKEFILNAKSGEKESYSIKVEIPEKEYSDDEAMQKMNELGKELPSLILGSNNSLLHITKPLLLENTYTGYPFWVEWESSNYRLIKNDGGLGVDEVEKNGENITLYATISYHELQVETTIEVTIFPKQLTEEEQMKDQIEKSLQQSQEQTKEKDYLQLPRHVNGKEIVWEKSTNGTIFILLTLSIVTLVGVWFFIDQEITKKVKERERKLGLEYSEFVSKLQLLIGCGMTIRRALEKMDFDYRKGVSKGGKRKYVYEELSLCIRKLQDGIGEAECYDFFGKRCNTLSYKKLSLLLIQNLNKGTTTLLYALSNETKLAFEERKHQARRMGEEAQTKLLFPMVLMLGIVMIIIIIPAYLSFGG